MLQRKSFPRIHNIPHTHILMFVSQKAWTNLQDECTMPKKKLSDHEDCIGQKLWTLYPRTKHKRKRCWHLHRRTEHRPVFSAVLFWLPQAVGIQSSGYEIWWTQSACCWPPSVRRLFAIEYLFLLHKYLPLGWTLSVLRSCQLGSNKNHFNLLFFSGFVLLTSSWPFEAGV